MASTNRQSANTVSINTIKTASIQDKLFNEPYRFEFHQAIKLLEHIFPEKTALGEAHAESDEAVKVKSRIYLESLASDIYSLNIENKDVAKPTLHVNFMGIAGIQGPLPFPYTEMMIQRQRAGDTSLVDFIDIFNHRLISILHRIRKQYTRALTTKTPDKSLYGKALQAFSGLGFSELQNRMAFQDRGILNYAGLLWAQNKSAGGLEQILQSYFKIPMTIETCVGKWRSLDLSQQTIIGKKGQWNQLGGGAAIGTRAWDQQSHFCVKIEILQEKHLAAFLPTGHNFTALNDIIKLYATPHLDYSFHFFVKKKNIPPLRLGKKSYLGWQTWLKPRHLEKEEDFDSQLKVQIIPDEVNKKIICVR